MIVRFLTFLAISLCIHNTYVLSRHCVFTEHLLSSTTSKACCRILYPAFHSLVVGDPFNNRPVHCTLPGSNSPCECVFPSMSPNYVDASLKNHSLWFSGDSTVRLLYLRLVAVTYCRKAPFNGTELWRWDLRAAHEAYQASCDVERIKFKYEQAVWVDRKRFLRYHAARIWNISFEFLQDWFPGTYLRPWDSWDDHVTWVKGFTINARRPISLSVHNYGLHALHLFPFLPPPLGDDYYTNNVTAAIGLYSEIFPEATRIWMSTVTVDDSVFDGDFNTSMHLLGEHAARCQNNSGRADYCWNATLTRNGTGHLFTKEVAAVAAQPPGSVHLLDVLTLTGSCKNCTADGRHYYALSLTMLRLLIALFNANHHGAG